jgi:hypothetical protein
MGSWEETCMVSQLPIRYEDPVKLFLLQQVRKLSENGGGYTMSSPIYEVMCPPLTGYYDDYGRIDGIEEDTSFQLLAHILPSIKAKVNISERAKDSWITPMGKKKPVDTDMDKVKQFLCFVERDGVTQNDKWFAHYQGLGIGVALIHEEIYQECLKIAKNPKLKQEILRISSLLQPDVKNTEGASKSLRTAFEFGDEMSGVFGYHSQWFAQQALREGTLYQNWKGEQHEGKHLQAEILEKVFDSMLEVLDFEGFLCNTRTSWMVQTGKGSQVWGLDEYHAHKTLADRIIKFCDRAIEDYNKE